MPPFSEFFITAKEFELLAEMLFYKCEQECCVVTVRKVKLGTPVFLLSTIFNRFTNI